MNRKTQTTILAIVMMFIGVALAIGGAGFVGDAFQSLITAIGVILIVFGIICFVGKEFPTGAICLAVGLLVIVFAWMLTWVAFLALGIALLVMGIIGLVQHRGWIAVNIISLIIGAAIISLSFGINFEWAKAVLTVLHIVCGVALIIDGILLLARHD